MFCSKSGWLAVVAIGLTLGCSGGEPSRPAAVPGAAGGPYQGHLDEANCRRIVGWAWNKEQPNTTVTVEVYDGDELIATLPADQYREGLRKAGKGDGKHSFIWSTPAGLKDGKQHQVRAKVAGSDFELKESPRPVTCAGKRP
jgi:hypothetical protein